MKLKRILSSALVVVLLFGAIIGAYPIAASAAYSSESGSSSLDATANLTTEQVESYLSTSYLMYDYATAEELLEAELEAGYLYSVNSANNYYTIYVNKYSGMLFYKNNVTGQILTSNPINPGYGNGAIESGERENLMSQIVVDFTETATNKPTTYTSYKWSAYRSQISVNPISGGLRVNYTIGDTTARFLLPGRIKAETFEELVIIPMIDSFKETLINTLGEDNVDLEEVDFFANSRYTPYIDGCINTSSNKNKNRGLLTYFNDMLTLVLESYKDSSREYKALYNIQSDTIKIVRAYTLKNPAAYEEGSDRLLEMNEEFPITAQGIAIYAYTGSSVTATKRQLSGVIKSRVSGLTYEIMYAEEAECGYVEEIVQKPVFRCALEYSFNSDGSLSIRLPASSITFDETVYTLTNITPVKFFGCADAKDEGYIFYPDGSGTVIRFSDFYNEENDKKIALSLNSTPYGLDYCYSKITGAHRQQVTMPVYGVVTEVNANETTKLLYGQEKVTNGYFAIIEEGSALANLGFDSGGSSYRFGGAYASYNPYPSDKFNLSETISVGSNAEYTIVSESKYTGSYVTRYVMLTDENLGTAAYGKDKFYESSYVGMASYYRNYLKENGTLEALEIVNEDLPLYIELLGSMEILAKVLTFPVTKSIALTSFEDVETIYNQLSDAKAFLTTKSAENTALAEATEDEELKASYMARAKEYLDMALAIDNITNVNFRLTGFANGGLKSTYPVKSRWERVCGGEDGFVDLINNANAISAEAGKNFGIYPDFDFMYINNTATFDGIGNRGNVSKMVDNRYASLQMYDSVSQTFETFFDLVISADALDSLYTKFNKDFADTGANKLSVSTLGSDLNSNFDKDNPVNRDEAREEIVNLLNRMTEEDGYELMMDIGNIYAVKYATHILNMTIDSSHLRYSSYSVPFIALVLHSYVNYTGTPLNYSGNLDYELLKSIESGAAPYYILCYQNSAYLKDDEELNSYYGVAYEHWYESILTTYQELNNQIGALQSYEIVDHDVLITERIIEDEEMAVNYVLLMNEILAILDAEIKEKVDEAFRALAANPEGYTKRVKVVVDRAALMAQFSEILNLDAATVEAYVLGSSSVSFGASLDSLIAKYTSEYVGDDANGNSYVIEVSSIDYESQYSYITDSTAFDKNYVKTEYTIDNGNVTMVTYKKGDHEVKFILNYNNYSVNVRIDADTVYTIAKCDYVRIG